MRGERERERERESDSGMRGEIEREAYVSLVCFSGRVCMHEKVGSSTSVQCRVVH